MIHTIKNTTVVVSPAPGNVRYQECINIILHPSLTTLLLPSIIGSTTRWSVVAGAWQIAHHPLFLGGDNFPRIIRRSSNRRRRIAMTTTTTTTPPLLCTKKDFHEQHRLSYSTTAAPATTTTPTSMAIMNVDNPNTFHRCCCVR